MRQDVRTSSDCRCPLRRCVDRFEACASRPDRLLTIVAVRVGVLTGSMPLARGRHRFVSSRGAMSAGRCSTIRPVARAKWRDYQDESAAFFRSLGLEAATDERIEGARAVHAVDVAVRSNQAGLRQLWIVECKLCKRRVEKVHVLALQSIVQDVGADRGILLSESGFNPGLSGLPIWLAGVLRACLPDDVDLSSPVFPDSDGGPEQRRA